MSSSGVLTPLLRIKFVKGWLSGGIDPGDGSLECGGGTGRVLVTRQQLEEVFYRVREGRFSGGSFRLDYTTDTATGYSVVRYEGGAFPHTLGNSFSVSGPYLDAMNPPTYQSSSSTSIDFSRIRGYGAEIIAGYPNQNLDYFSETYMQNGHNYTDILPSEFGTWVTKDLAGGDMYINRGFENPYVNGLRWIESSNIDPFTGPIIGTDVPPVGFDINECFQCYLVTVPGGSDPPWGTYAFAEVFLFIDNTIAYVKGVGGSDNPFDPANSLYMGVSFTVDNVTSPASDSIRSNDINTLGIVHSTSMKLVIDSLQSGNIEVPLYWHSEDIYTDITTRTEGDNFIFTVFKWWPYAKNSPPEPVWDSTTGILL